MARGAEMPSATAQAGSSWSLMRWMATPGADGHEEDDHAGKGVRRAVEAHELIHFS